MKQLTPMEFAAVLRAKAAMQPEFLSAVVKETVEFGAKEARDILLTAKPEWHPLAGSIHEESSGLLGSFGIPADATDERPSKAAAVEFGSKYTGMPTFFIRAATQRAVAFMTKLLGDLMKAM